MSVNDGSTIVIDKSRVILQIVVSLTGNSRGIIYNDTCGRYCKQVTIVNGNSNIASKWSFKLIDDPRVVIYDGHGFTIQATVGTIKRRHFLLK